MIDYSQNNDEQEEVAYLVLALIEVGQVESGSFVHLKKDL